MTLAATECVFRIMGLAATIHGANTFIRNINTEDLSGVLQRYGRAPSKILVQTICYAKSLSGIENENQNFGFGRSCVTKICQKPELWMLRYAKLRRLFEVHSLDLVVDSYSELFVIMTATCNTITNNPARTLLRYRDPGTDASQQTMRIVVIGRLRV